MDRPDLDSPKPGETLVRLLPMISDADLFCAICPKAKLPIHVARLIEQRLAPSPLLGNNGQQQKGAENEQTK